MIIEIKPKEEQEVQKTFTQLRNGKLYLNITTKEIILKTDVSTAIIFNFGIIPEVRLSMDDSPPIYIPFKGSIILKED